MTEPAVDPRTVFVEYRPGIGRRKLLLIAVLLAVVLLLVAAVAVVRGTVSAPESAVRAFFGALADRDAAAALAASAPEVRDQPGAELLTDDVLAAEGYHPPDGVSITDVSVEDRSAEVTVEFGIDGREHTATLRLRRAGGLVDSVFHEWLVVDGIGSLMLTDVVPEQITVNGLPLAARDEQGPRLLPALPGSYEIGVPDGDPLWRPQSVSTQVTPQAATEVRVPLEVRPEVREEIERQVYARLDQCAASTELLPPNCPFGYQVTLSAGDVQWRITKYPALAMTPGEEFGQVVVVVSTSEVGLGEAVVTGTRRFVGSFEQPVQFPVTGIVTGDGDSIRFEPTW
ncbi:MAG TPA: hypothetical protein VIL37_07975 [Natronosporangium sp.]